MVFNITYRDDTIRDEIDQIVGQSFSFWARFKKGGIGSPRMIISKASNNLQRYLSPEHYITYSSVELRPKGILLYINQGAKRFAWPIPFHQLVIHQRGGFEIQSNGEFIRYRASNDVGQDEFMVKIEAAIAKSNSNIYPEYE